VGRRGGLDQAPVRSVGTGLRRHRTTNFAILYIYRM
jgi:hypothetical protein